MDKDTKTPDLLSVKQAADLLGVSTRTIFRYMYDQEPPLKYIRVGQSVIIERSALDEFVEASKTGKRRTVKAVMNQKK